VEDGVPPQADSATAAVIRARAATRARRIKGDIGDLLRAGSRQVVERAIWARRRGDA
jgi:hypothetical protein